MLKVPNVPHQSRTVPYRTLLCSAPDLEWRWGGGFACLKSKILSLVIPDAGIVDRQDEVPV